MPPTEKIQTTLSLFSGIGGLDLGLKHAGFEVALCVEKDEECRKSLRAQGLPLSPVGDIREFSPKDALYSAGLKRGELPLLAGGPPCQSFSKAAQWNGRRALMADERGRLVATYLDYVRETLPKVFVLENVIGFDGRDSGSGYVAQELEQLNASEGTSYRLSLWRVNAANYGVPQIRRRIFLVAHREGKELLQPPETHGEELQPYITAWDALSQLEAKPDKEALRPRGKWAELLPSIPEGQNYLFHTSRGGGLPLFGWRTRYWSFLLKLSKCAPSWTVSASPGPATGPFHWENRYLSEQELLLLQTFPQTHPVSSSYREAVKQIGNAVPPALGELIGRTLRRAQGADISLSLDLIPPRSGMAPDESFPQKVPKKFLSLVGEHPDHPGHGQGPGSRKVATG